MTSRTARSQLRELLARPIPEYWHGIRDECDQVPEFDMRQRQKMEKGVVLQTWCEIERVHGPSPPDEIADLSHVVRTQDLRVLLATLNESATPYQVVRLAPAIGGPTARQTIAEWLSTPDLGEWMVGLGLLRSMNWIMSEALGQPTAAGEPPDSADRCTSLLRWLGDLLHEGFPNYSPSLWWQVWGQVRSFGPKDSSSASDFRRAIATEVAHRISVAGGAHTIPKVALRAEWFYSHPDWTCILPAIARQSSGSDNRDFTSLILEVEKARICGEAYQLPRLDSDYSNEAVNAVTWALLEFPEELELFLREGIKRVVGRRVPWPLGQEEYGDTDRIARYLLLGCATAFAFRAAGRDGWAALATEVLDVASVELGDTGYRGHSISGVLQNLPVNLVKLSLLLSPDAGIPRVEELSQQVRDAGVLDQILKQIRNEAPDALVDTVQALYSDRLNYEKLLEAPS